MALLTGGSLTNLLYHTVSLHSNYGSIPILRDILRSSDFAKDIYLLDPAIGAAN